MTRIVLGADQRAALAAGSNRAEFVDDQGNVLGHFLSVDAYERFVALLFPPFTNERIAAANRDAPQNGGVRGADLFARLERIAGPVGSGGGRVLPETDLYLADIRSGQTVW